MMNRTQTSIRARLAGVAATSLAGLLLVACAAKPSPKPQPQPPPQPPPQPQPVQRVYNEAPPPNTDVYAYPLHGQAPPQQDRDHYECSQWATQQTGFDPSAPGVPPHQQVRVVSGGPPPGTGTAVGAVTGAIIGAAISPSWQSATGALAGAVVGGAIGSAADAANAQQTRTVVVNDRRQAAMQEQKAANYRRAIGACLDARGYSVR